MYKYEIVNTYPDGVNCKFKPSDFNEVINLMQFCIQSKKYDGFLKFFLSGKESTAEELLQAAQGDKDAYWAKKYKTHKKISVRTGVTGFVKKTVWVRK